MTLNNTINETGKVTSNKTVPCILNLDIETIFPKQAMDAFNDYFMLLDVI